MAYVIIYYKMLLWQCVLKLYFVYGEVLEEVCYRSTTLLVPKISSFDVIKGALMPPNRIYYSLRYAHKEIWGLQTTKPLDFIAEGAKPIGFNTWQFSNLPLVMISSLFYDG